MAQNSVKATLIIRNDSAASWAAKNPKLARGEVGIEIDTGLVKVGDGTTNFNGLDYINTHNDVDGILTTLVNNKVTVADYGKSYWYYDENNLEEVQVNETDLTKWPTRVELEVKNGVARWVRPKSTYNPIQGTLDGVLVTLARDPQTNNEASTKNYVDTTVASAIANVDHLKRRIVTTLPTVSIESNTIYMIKDDTATGADKYKEYILIDGTLTQIGDTSVDLTNYVQKPTVQNAGNLVSVAADGSLIDSGVAASDIGKLNIATTSVLGGVYSSNADNSVSVDSITGIMSLNRVSTTKLYVPVGDEFILNGGTA